MAEEREPIISEKEEFKEFEKKEEERIETPEELKKFGEETKKKVEEFSKETIEGGKEILEKEVESIEGKEKELEKGKEVISEVGREIKELSSKTQKEIEEIFEVKSEKSIELEDKYSPVELDELRKKTAEDYGEGLIKKFHKKRENSEEYKVAQKKAYRELEEKIGKGAVKPDSIHSDMLYRLELKDNLESKVEKTEDIPDKITEEIKEFVDKGFIKEKEADLI